MKKQLRTRSLSLSLSLFISFLNLAFQEPEAIKTTEEKKEEEDEVDVSHHTYLQIFLQALIGKTTPKPKAKRRVLSDDVSHHTYLQFWWAI